MALDLFVQRISEERFLRSGFLNILLLRSLRLVNESLGNFNSRPTVDYEKCVFLVLCSLTSFPANKLPPMELSHGFALQVQNFSMSPSRDVPRYFSLEGEGVF